MRRAHHGPRRWPVAAASAALIPAGPAAPVRYDAEESGQGAHDDDDSTGSETSSESLAAGQTFGRAGPLGQRLLKDRQHQGPGDPCCH